MDRRTIKQILCGIDKMMNNEVAPVIEASGVTFDKKAFESRLPIYEKYGLDDKLTMKDLAKKAGVDFEQYEVDTHIFACLRPEKILLKHLSAIIKSDMSKQKQLQAVSIMKDRKEVLTMDVLCEKLGIDDVTAESILKQIDPTGLPIQAIKENAPIMFREFMADQKLQLKVMKFFNENKYAPIDEAIKCLGINIKVPVLKNCIKTMVDNGYKIHCISVGDPLQIAAQSAEIVSYKQKHPYATDKHIASLLDVSPKRVADVIESAALVYKREKIRSYEFMIKDVAEKLDMVCDEALMKHHSTTSSRWLELYQMSLDKKVKLLGLDAPKDIYVHQSIEVSSKEDRDKIIDAYFASEDIDIDKTKLIEGN